MKSSGQRSNENVIPIDNAKRKPAKGDGSGQCRLGKRRFANGERTTDENRCQLICEDGQLINDNFGCKFRGHCYRPDETWVDGCSEYKCEINYEPKTVKYEAVVSKHNEGCQVAGTDKCYRDGEEWKTDCKVFKCVVSVNVQENNTHGQRVVRNDIVIVEKECKDYDGNCHKPGQNFTYNCFGKRCHDCSCELVNDRVMYSCPIQVT